MTLAQASLRCRDFPKEIRAVSAALLGTMLSRSTVCLAAWDMRASIVASGASHRMVRFQAEALLLADRPMIFPFVPSEPAGAVSSATVVPITCRRSHASRVAPSEFCPQPAVDNGDIGERISGVDRPPRTGSPARWPAPARPAFQLRAGPGSRPRSRRRAAAGQTGFRRSGGWTCEA